MRALVMCGGRGTRLDAAAEKPLFEVAGEPMVSRVVDALAGSSVEAVYAAVSPNAPDTAATLRERAGDGALAGVVETPGEGYVADLGAALDDARLDPPVVTAAADLPLLAADCVDRALDRYAGDGSLSVCVPAALKAALGVSAEATRDRGGRELAPTGLNVVGDGPAEAVAVSWDARLAVNVNYRADARVAAELAAADGRDDPPEVADGP